jgi:hypothetical protein
MDDETANLREEVEQLKQIVASQQATIDDLENQSLLGPWGRRGLLGSIAAALGLASTSGSAAGQAAGQVGTSGEPVDVFAESINGGGPVTDGDDTERQIWIITNGASDPAAADPEDLIFEEES